MNDQVNELQAAVMRAIEHAVDALACDRHNDGGSLTGNTQASDQAWLASVLFSSSRLGAGDVRTMHWAISREQWKELGLEPEAIFGDGPRRFDMLTAEQREPWLKLARIVMYVIPVFADRVGRRWMLQSKAIRTVWEACREEDVKR